MYVYEDKYIFWWTYKKYENTQSSISYIYLKTSW